MGQGFNASSFRQEGLSPSEQKILADKVQRIERTLNQLEFNEYDGTHGENLQRAVRVNIDCGVIKREWIKASNAGTGNGGLPSNANKSKWMVVTMSDDNATADDNPELWSVDWTRAHA